MPPEPRSIHIQYYGALQEHSGCSSEECQSQAGTVAELFEELQQSGRLRVQRNGLSVAVNDAFVSWNQALAPGDRVALMPPMAGG